MKRWTSERDGRLRNHFQFSGDLREQLDFVRGYYGRAGPGSVPIPFGESEGG